MIGDFFIQDHREIDALYQALYSKLAALPPAPSPAQAQALVDAFGTMQQRLERHIRWEEEILFPAVEAKASELADGPGRVMRQEHVEIRAFLRRAEEHLGAGAPGAAARQAIQAALHGAEGVLREHNEKEETIYYPLCDETFPREEAARLLDRLREDRL